jgi:heme/copper-type cytochrome/quinol oxidase subunit 2
MKRKLLLALLLAGAAPSPLFACAACYGKTDSPLATGMNYGILTLLGVVLSVLSVFVVCFVHIVRKSEAMHQEAVKRMEEL